MLSGNNLFKSTKHCKNHITNYVGLRWKTKPRKPFWLGLAKTKLFVIPEKKLDPPEQLAELKRLHYIYDRQMRALKNFMMTNVNYQLDQEKEIDVTVYKKEAKLLHERWNAESARLREERLKKEKQEKEETILSKVMKKEERLKQVKAKVEEIVQREIELSETYITEENLDKAIDECLESVSDYNYALDLAGNIYKGDSMKPTDRMKPVGSSSGVEDMIPETSSSTEKEMSKVS